MHLHKIHTKGLIFGQSQIYLPSCQSTNSELALRVRKEKVYEGTLLWTDCQTAGRGQRGNSWQSQIGKNLTFSLFVQPSFLRATESFWLTMAVALGIWDTLKELTKDFEVLTEEWKIKWTNDIFINDQKIGGILIENTLSNQFISQSIIGVGLNINQMTFDLDRATSLYNQTNQNWDKEAILTEVLLGIEKRYLQLRAGKRELLRTDYINALYRYQEWHLYKKNDDKVLGQILGIDQQGRLAIEINRQIEYFNHKEVEFLF